MEANGGSSEAGVSISAATHADPATGVGETLPTARPTAAATPPPASPDVPLSPEAPLSPGEPAAPPLAILEHQQTALPAAAAPAPADPPAPSAALPAPPAVAVEASAAEALPRIPALVPAAPSAVAVPAHPAAPAPVAASAVQAVAPAAAPALQPVAPPPQLSAAAPAVPVLQPAAPTELAGAVGAPQPAAAALAAPAAPAAAVVAAPAVPALAPAAPQSAPIATAPLAPAAPTPPPTNPADFEQPEMPEEKHPQKPTWRRGYQQYHKTEYIMVTLTPSDCSTKRLRPPREWYDAFLGANSLNFVVGTQALDGTAVSFLLKAHSYEYVKAEYYVQGGETKRMFRALGLQPGDALKLTLQGKSSGIPTTRLVIIPAARNPHAAAILAQAAEQAAKRAERLAANPKGPKGQKKRKKAAGDDDDDDDEGFMGAPGEGCAAGRRMRQRSKKQFGDDFVSGLDEAWAAAQHSDDDYQPHSDYEGDDKRRRRAGSRSAAASSGHAWAASAAALQQQQQPSGSGLAGAGMPEVVATEAADGRNVLRIKINRPGKQGEAGAVGAAAGGSARGRGSDPGCPLNFLAGLADGMGTPMGQQGAAGGVAAVGSGAAAAPKDAPKAEPVVLLSKKLLRDDAGAVTGATCKLGWETGSRTALAVSRAISQFGVAHANSAAVETFEVQPEQCLVELTLRLQAAAAGRVDVLETALVQLLDAL